MNCFDEWMRNPKPRKEKTFELETGATPVLQTK